MCLSLQAPTSQATGFYFRRSRSGNYNQKLLALRSSEESKRSEPKIKNQKSKIRGLLVTKFLILDSAPFNRGACVQASRIPTQFVSRTSPLGTLPTNLVEARLSESTLRIIQSKFSSNHCVTLCCEGLVSTMQFSLDHKRRFKMRRKWTRPDSCDFDSI